MNTEPSEPNPPEKIGRFIGAAFGLIFLTIGLCVIGFLWSAPFGQFGSPPVFFRIFGSLVACGFVVMGGGTAYAAIMVKPNLRRHFRNSFRSKNAHRQDSPDRPLDRSNDSYGCPSCGAPLSTSADVSPHGDVKCLHCNRWFNAHGK